MAASRLLLQLLPSVRGGLWLWTRPLTYAARPRFAVHPQQKKRRSIVMANVTKANFEDNCKQLQTHLQLADFVALDFEMTGVENAPWRRYSELDTCETRYQHLKHSAEAFAVWQCGVCPFKWDESGQKYIAYPYNFYLFPRNELPVDMASRSYFCQTSSLEFLAKHHFDFNATVYNGISYLSLEQEEVARVKLGLTEEVKKLKLLRAASESDIPLTKTADVVFTERIRVQVGQWRDGVLREKIRWQGTDGEMVQRSKGSSFVVRRAHQNISARPLDSEVVETSQAENPNSKDSAKEMGVGDKLSIGVRPSYYVDIFGNNHARLVKQLLRKHYEDLVPVVIHNPNDAERRQVRIIFTSSKEDRVKLEEELEWLVTKDLEAVLSSAVGFRKVIDAIISAGKPLIGHNCLLDLAHLHDKFFGPLPPNVKGFSVSLLGHLPCILDTKYLLKTEPTLRGVNVNRSTSLAIAYQELCQGFNNKPGIPGKFSNGKPRIVGKPMSRVKLEIASELQRYSDGLETGLKHEAGFDAYMTGAVFAQLCHILRVDIGTIRCLRDAVRGESTGFASYANLLMLQTFRGQSALDLSTGTEAVGIKAPRGPVTPPYRLLGRENVVFVWGALPTYSHELYLRKMVHNILGKDMRSASVEVHVVDQCSAFIEFRSSANLETFFRVIQDSQVGVVSGGTVADTRDEYPVKVARFLAYERICRSPLATQSLGMAADLLGTAQLGAVDLSQTHNRKQVTPPDEGLNSSKLPSECRVQITNESPFEVGPWAQHGSSLDQRGADAAQASGDGMCQVSSDQEPMHGLEMGGISEEDSAMAINEKLGTKRLFDEGGAGDGDVDPSSAKKRRGCQSVEDVESYP